MELRTGKNGLARCFVKLGFGSDSGTKKGNKNTGEGELSKKKLWVCSEVDRLKFTEH